MTHRNDFFVRALAFVLVLLFSGPGLAATDVEQIGQLMAVADSLHANGRSDSAITVARRAERIARRVDEPGLVLTVNSSLGVYLRSNGQVDEALRCYDQALKIVTTPQFREQPDEEDCESAASLYVNLSALHIDMSHKELASTYARQAAAWAEKCTDGAFRAGIFGVVGSVLTFTGQLEDAMRYQQRAYEDALEAGDTEQALRAAAYGMLTCDRAGRVDDVEAWRRKCRALLGPDLSIMARLLYFQIECAISQGHQQTRASIAWFDSILALPGIEGMPFVAFDCYNNLHQSYAELGRYDSAYATLLRSNALRDTLFEAQKVESLRELTVKYDAKEKELALARSEAERANVRFRLAVALAVLAVMLALFALYILRQRRRRHAQELEFAALRADTGRQLTASYVEGLESERTRMARELHDGVCNDLTAIQMSLAGESPASSALAQLDVCRDQVRRISHELMPPEFTYATIDAVLRYYVGKLGKAQPACRCTYASLPEGADWQAVPDALALEMYRIVQEAAGNAIRHSGALNLDVTLERTGEGLRLTVGDDGRLRASQSTGIGLRTMRQRAAAVGGRLDVDHSAGGTVVRLSLKL